MTPEPENAQDKYFPKFRTIRRSTGDELDPATTFTLLPNKDKHAVVALRAYVNSIDPERKGLGKALAEAFPDIDRVDVEITKDNIGLRANLGYVEVPGQ